MPMTWPEVPTSGPPESPGWMPALISMSPDRFSALPPPLSLAVMDWSVAITEPPAALGVQPDQQQACRGEDRAGGGGRRVDQERDDEDDSCDETQHCRILSVRWRRNRG